ncbi:amine sulfotransferase-like [Patiria miniata]|uniref:Sulfotransferase domain-containing protein n=1 Tax=Patiria miniata TaxID=46514 RepID=A0A914B596_PATMI|nr:amine sulfotransferase-like [Patiria miniata]
MDVNGQVKALLPEVINGKTLKELEEETTANDKKYAHFVKGVKLPYVVPLSTIEALKTFEVRDDDVCVVTYPRSGTHWMTEIVSFILNDGRDDFDRTFMTCTLEVTYTPDPSKVESTIPGYKKFEEVKSPRCTSSHLPYSLLPPDVMKSKVVYLARNPKDMLVSYFNFTKAYLSPTFQDFSVYLWLHYAGEMIFGSWFDHVLGYWRQKDHPNILFMNYEDLHKDLKGSIRTVAKHVGKDLSDDVIDRITERVSFGGMKSTYDKFKDVYGEAEALQMTNKFGEDTVYLRKGKVGNWRNTFTEEQSALFDKMYALRMDGTGLEFDFDP